MSIVADEDQCKVVVRKAQINGAIIISIVSVAVILFCSFIYTGVDGAIRVLAPEDVDIALDDPVMVAKGIYASDDNASASIVGYEVWVFSDQVRERLIEDTFIVLLSDVGYGPSYPIFNTEQTEIVASSGFPMWRVAASKTVFMKQSDRKDIVIILKVEIAWLDESDSIFLDVIVCPRATLESGVVEDVQVVGGTEVWIDLSKRTTIVNITKVQLDASEAPNYWDHASQESNVYSENNRIYPFKAGAEITLDLSWSDLMGGGLK